MKTQSYVPILALAGALWAMVFLAGLADAAAPPAKHFKATLRGDNEVPPRVTDARGIAQFEITPDGQALKFNVTITQISNVVAGHIHLGPPGMNGPVVAHLFGPAPAGGGEVNGKIADHEVVAADLVGPLAGQPFSALLTQMRNGNTYVNFHTNDGVAPVNTGPGDFPGGEVRGQIVPRP